MYSLTLALPFSKSLFSELDMAGGCGGVDVASRWRGCGRGCDTAEARLANYVTRLDNEMALPTPSLSHPLPHHLS